MYLSGSSIVTSNIVIANIVTSNDYFILSFFDNKNTVYFQSNISSCLYS